MMLGMVMPKASATIIKGAAMTAVRKERTFPDGVADSSGRPRASF
jgi:hypothetical protein